jgi:chromosome partitioning protein
MIVAFVSQRGGVGKTTLALHVAGEFSRRGERVTLIDADPQESALGWALARAWSERARRFAIIGLASETLSLEVPDIARANDHVIIDGPPRTPALTQAVLVAADRVVIPVQPGPFDVWTRHEIVDLVKEVQFFRPRLTAAFVTNRVIVGSVIARAMAKPLSRTAIGRLPVEVHQRVLFAECLSRGLLASEVEPSGAAADDIRRLVNAIRRLRP